MNESFTPSGYPDFEGWMLWNIVRHEHMNCDAPWPDGIFEDQSPAVQAAWKRSATMLQHRAKQLGRLV